MSGPIWNFDPSGTYFLGRPPRGRKTPKKTVFSIWRSSFGATEKFLYAKHFSWPKYKKKKIQKIFSQIFFRFFSQNTENLTPTLVLVFSYLVSKSMFWNIFFWTCLLYTTTTCFLCPFGQISMVLWCFEAFFLFLDHCLSPKPLYEGHNGACPDWQVLYKKPIKIQRCPN